MLASLLDEGASVLATNEAAETALHIAASLDAGPEVVRILLDHGAEVDPVTTLGRTPLHVAAMGSGNAAAVDLLLRRGADPFQVDHNGKTPWALATESGNVAVAELLAAQAERLTLANAYQLPAWTLAYGDWARTATVSSMIAVLDANPDALSSRLRNGRSLLSNVVELNPDPAVTALLMTRMPDGVDANDLLGLASQNPNSDVARMLLEGGAPIRPNVLANALWNAAANPNPGVTALLLDAGASIEQRVVARAAQNRDPKVLEMLLDRGAGASGALLQAASNRNPAVSELLVDGGTDIHVANAQGNTALHIAVSNPNPAVARLLLNRGADINAANRQGRNPLEQAVAVGGRPSVVQLLLDAGAQSANELWWQPLGSLSALSRDWLARGSLAQVEGWVAAQVSGDEATVNRYRNASAAILRAAASNPNPAVLGFLLDSGADPAAAVSELLHRAARLNSNPAAIELLMNRGAQVAALEGMFPPSWTALHRAARWNANPAVAHRLAELGAEIGATDAMSSATPLHLAARFSPPAVVEALLAVGADASAVDDGGATPLLSARLNPRAGVQAALLAAGASPFLLPAKRLADPEWLSAATIAAVEAQAIIASDEDLWRQDGCGRTPFHLVTFYTAKYGDVGYAENNHYGRGWRALFQRLSTEAIRESDATGNTALHYAAAGTSRYEESRALNQAPSGGVSGATLSGTLVWSGLVDPLAVGGGDLQAIHYSLWPLGSPAPEPTRLTAFLQLRNWGDPSEDPRAGESFPNGLVPADRFDACLISLP